MMQQFEEDPFNGNRGEKSSNPNELTALQVLKLRLGLENSPNLNAPLRSQEDAIRNLSHQDWTIRLEAVRMLSNLKNQCLIVKAEELINDENVAIREAMAEALGRLGGEASIALLLKCLEDKDWSVRATAFQSLGKLGDIVPLEPLVEGLRDEDVSVRLAALKALEKHATRVPLETFVSTSKDKDSCIRMAGTRVIERLLEHPEQCLLSNKTIEVLIEPTFRSFFVILGEKPACTIEL